MSSRSIATVPSPIHWSARSITSPTPTTVQKPKSRRTSSSTSRPTRTGTRSRARSRSTSSTMFRLPRRTSIRLAKAKPLPAPCCRTISSAPTDRLRPARLAASSAFARLTAIRPRRLHRAPASKSADFTAPSRSMPMAATPTSPTPRAPIRMWSTCSSTPSKTATGTVRRPR